MYACMYVCVYVRTYVRKYIHRQIHTVLCNRNLLFNAVDILLPEEPQGKSLTTKLSMVTLTLKKTSLQLAPTL